MTAATAFISPPQCEHFSRCRLNVLAKRADQEKTIRARRGSLFAVGVFLYRYRRNDFPSILGVRRKDAKISHYVSAGRGYEGADFFNKLKG